MGLILTTSDIKTIEFNQIIYSKDNDILISKEKAAYIPIIGRHFRCNHSKNNYNLIKERLPVLSLLCIMPSSRELLIYDSTDIIFCSDNNVYTKGIVHIFTTIWGT